MLVRAFKIRPLLPPKDSLLAALLETPLSLKEGDILAISSKVVSIDEGRCEVRNDSLKENLIQRESDQYFKFPVGVGYRRLFTVAHGALVGSAGIDESNGSDHFVLYPKNPFKSAKRLRRLFQKVYGVQKLGLILTDSTSTPLRRGAIGFALAWDGIDPLRDYRGTKDIFDRTIAIEMANLVDGLAATAVLEMGEGKEQTPVAVIRDAKNIVFKNRSPKKDQLIIAPEDDIFAPFLFRKKWKKGGGGK